MLRPTKDQMCVNVSLFLHTHFVRSGSVILQPALCAMYCREPDRLQHHIPTSHEVGMQHLKQFVVGRNIKTHLWRGGYARKTDAHPHPTFNSKKQGRDDIFLFHCQWFFESLKTAGRSYSTQSRSLDEDCSSARSGGG